MRKLQEHIWAMWAWQWGRARWRPGGIFSMGQEPDGLEDERTWQQPIPAQGVGRPHDRPTEHTATPEDREPVARPDATDPSPTSPSLADSGVPQGSSAGGSSDSEPRRTLPVSGDSSGSWDSLSPPIFEVGKVVFGKYRLVEKIGEGGMGEVWRVWHLSLESERALKLIKPELAHNDKGWRRFQREARLMAKINHPNAVAVYDFQRTQSVAYIEMEFIRGRSLSDVLKEGRGQPMPLEWTAQVLEQLCAVLHEAHGHVDETTGQPKPIIHRDLKPSNLMLVERKGDTGPPRLKVLDFGIAKIVEDDGIPRPDRSRRSARHSGLHEPRTDPRRMRGEGRPSGDRWAKRPVLHRGGPLSPPDRGPPVPRRQDGAAGGAPPHAADADEGGESQGRCPRRGRAGGDAVPGEGSRSAPPERTRTLRAIPPGRRHRRGRLTTRCRRHGPMAAAGRHRRGRRAGLRHRPGGDA